MNTIEQIKDFKRNFTLNNILGRFIEFRQTQSDFGEPLTEAVLKIERSFSLILSICTKVIKTLLFAKLMAQRILPYINAFILVWGIIEWSLSLLLKTKRCSVQCCLITSMMM